MAKVKGQEHSDLARGSVGPITHRVYRGVGTASRRRHPSRTVLKSSAIRQPSDIPNIFSRHCARIGYQLRTVGVNYYLKSLLDLVGGFGTLSQLVDANQPRWLPADPLHNNRPYIYPDGINDFMVTPTLPVSFDLPFDVWVIMYDAGYPSVSRAPLCFSSMPFAHLNCSQNVALQWVWQAPPVGLLALWSNSTAKIWRIVFQSGSIQIFWNGIQQSLPKSIPPQQFNLLQLFAAISLAGWYNKPLFEICTWRRILNPVEVVLLQNYFSSFYNIPLS